jgi:uncharacterized protein (TIGR03437 family)
MHRVFIILMVTIAVSGGLIAQTPAVTSIQNPASNLPTQIPAGGIAQGAIFVVYGSSLGPTTIVQPTALPLPTTAGLGGTVVTVTVNGTTLTAPMIYSLNSQIAAVMPSTIPVGSGTLTVTYNGKAGAPFGVRVVASSFGISTVDQTGGNAAVVTFPPTAANPTFALVTPTNSTKPGDVLVLWGTGLGATAGSDAIVPQSVDLGTPIQVLVGGIQATVLYRGRSAAPGLDQINFTVPPGVSGAMFRSRSSREAWSATTLR